MTFYIIYLRLIDDGTILYFTKDAGWDTSKIHAYQFTSYPVASLVCNQLNTIICQPVFIEEVEA